MARSRIPEFESSHPSQPVRSQGAMSARQEYARHLCRAFFSISGHVRSNPLSENSSGIRVVRSDRINRQISDPRISSIRPIFVAALATAMLPTCTQSCDALSSGEQFSIAADLFTHPVSIYWRDRLLSKTHSPSSLLAHRFRLDSRYPKFGRAQQVP